MSRESGEQKGLNSAQQLLNMSAGLAKAHGKHRIKVIRKRTKLTHRYSTNKDIQAADAVVKGRHHHEA